LVRHELAGGKTFKNNGLGWIPETALFLAETPTNFKRLILEENVNILEDRFSNLSGFNGTPNAEESYLLLSRYDGILEEGVVELIDLTNFKVLHTWNPDIDEFNEQVEQVDEFEFLSRNHNNRRQTLWHPKLIKDGGFVIQYITSKKNKFLF